MSTSGTPLGGRGTPSRRSSRDLSPSKKSSSVSSVTGQQDATVVAGHGDGGSAGTASSSASGTGQDWRKLVGSIRRKVRRKTTQNSSSITETLDTTNRNQDDFLKAAMRIFLVVSPPMGRIQVKCARRPHSRCSFVRVDVNARQILLACFSITETQFPFS